MIRNNIYPFVCDFLRIEKKHRNGAYKIFSASRYKSIQLE